MVAILVLCAAGSSAAGSSAAGSSSSGSSGALAAPQVSERTEGSPSITEIYKELGRLKDAKDREGVVEFLERVLPTFLTPSQSSIYLYRELAEMSRRLQDWAAADRAIAEGKKSAAILEDPKRPPGWIELSEAQLLEVEARLAIDRGLPDLAEIPQERILRLIDDLENHSRSASRRHALLWRARVRDIELLLHVRSLERVLRRSSEWQDPPGGTEARIALLRGQAQARLARQGDASERDAVESFLRVLDHPEASSNSRIMASSSLAIIHVLAKRWTEAEEELLRADQLLTDRDRDPLQLLLIQSVDARLKLGRGSSSEELRQSLSAIEVSLDRVWQRWDRDRPREGGSGILRSGRMRSGIAASIALVDRLNGNEAAFDHGRTLIGRANAHGRIPRALGGGIPTTEDLRLALPEGWGLVFYLPSGQFDTQIFVLDREEARVFTGQSRDGIEALRREFLSHALRSPQEIAPDRRAQRRQALDRTSRELGQRLFPDDVWARVERWSGVVLGSSGVLGYLPFEAIDVGRGAERVELGLSKPIIYWPSLTSGVGLVQRSTLPLNLVSNPLWARVTDSRPTAEVQKRYPGVADWVRDDSDPSEEWGVLSGESATYDRLAQRLQAPDSSLLGLHFLVHGVHDRRREASPALVVSPDSSNPDGLIAADELAGLRLPHLVVLTACGSGRGAQRWGDPGATDLSGAAILGGANCVLAPYAKLELESTREASRVFFRELEGGASPAVAQWKARRHMVASGRTDPFYYALLHVHGNGGEPLMAPRPRTDVSQIATRGNGWIVGGVMFAACVTLAWAIWRRRPTDTPG